MSNEDKVIRFFNALAPFFHFSIKHPIFTAAVIFIIGYVVIDSVEKSEVRSANEKIEKERKDKLDAMSTEERAKFLLDEQKSKEEKEKQKKFSEERVNREYLLKGMIRKSAFDPDAMKFGETKYFSNGVCVYANGKNRFGAYVGFKEYCYLINKKGEWYIQEPLN